MVRPGVRRTPRHVHMPRRRWQRTRPDLLQQWQRVGTQPVFDNFPGFDAKEVHPRILDLFANGGRRSSWHPPLIGRAKEPATGNQVVFSERANRGRKAVVGKGCQTPTDPLLQSIGAMYLTRTIAYGSEMRDEVWRDDLISDGQIAIP